MTFNLFLILFFVSFQTFAEPTIHLGIGETFKIPSQALETLRIQRKGIVQIKDEGHQILLVGKKLGATTLSLGKKQYQIEVLHKKSKESLHQLEEWLKDKRGPSIKIIDQLPELQGRLLRWQDLRDLTKFTHAESQFRTSMTMDQETQALVKQFIKKLVTENNLVSGDLTFSPHWRYGVAPSEKNNLSLYKKLLNPFGIEIRIDPLAVGQTPLVEIQVFVAHVKKSFLRQWGLRWPSEVQAQLISGGSLTWESLNFSFKALEDRGEGHLLATPRLVTESNKEAEFHSGGEIPIRTTTQFSNNIEWKRYGLFLKTKVLTNPKKNLKVEIELEISSLDQDNSATDIPAMSRSQIKTQVNMKRPQPIFLSGFLQQQSGESTSGLPWLSQIPIFSPLFANGQIYNRDYELIFVLYPRIMHDSTTIDY